MQRVRVGVRVPRLLYGSARRVRRSIDADAILLAQLWELDAVQYGTVHYKKTGGV